MILAILNLHVSAIQLTVWEMSFEEFQVGRNDHHLGYRNEMILAIQNLYVTRYDASHQISAQSDLQLRRRCRSKNFKMATIAVILGIGTERF